MPNWCEGNIRFKGTKANIKIFLTNEIVSCRMKDHETIEEKPIVQDDDYMMLISHPWEHSWFYIRNTHRNFFEDDVLEIWFDEDNEDKEIIVCIDSFKVAWSFDKCDVWKDITKKYNFDVKLTGYEKGGLFTQVKTFFRDGIVKEEVKEYKDTIDWMWNCAQPNMGG